MHIDAAIALNLATAWFLTGLIWFVQVVHYPLFAAVGEDRFRDYHAAHTFRTTLVVIVPMMLDLAGAVWLAIDRPQGIAPWVAWTGLALSGLAWLSTAALQVPQHNRLSGGFAPEVHRRLVTTNILRTGTWTARALVLTAAAVS